MKTGKLYEFISEKVIVKCMGLQNEDYFLLKILLVANPKSFWNYPDNIMKIGKLNWRNYFKEL